MARIASAAGITTTAGPGSTSLLGRSRDQRPPDPSGAAVGPHEQVVEIAVGRHGPGAGVHDQVADPDKVVALERAKPDDRRVVAEEAAPRVVGRGGVELVLVEVEVALPELLPLGSVPGLQSSNIHDC